MGIWHVIGVAAAIGAGQAAVWATLMRRTRAQADGLRCDVERSGEHFVIEPVKGTWQGGGDYVSRKTMGVMALTSSSLMFRPPLGKDIIVPLSGIDSVSADTWFKGNYRSGRNWLILRLRDGSEMAFMTGEHDRWMQEMRRLASAS